jgi:hypothetical protein
LAQDSVVNRLPADSPGPEISSCANHRGHGRKCGDSLRKCGDSTSSSAMATAIRLAPVNLAGRVMDLYVCGVVPDSDKDICPVGACGLFPVVAR